MKTKLIRSLSIALVLALSSTALVGCGETPPVKLYELPAEEQIFQDSYDKNIEINEFLTYTTNYSMNDSGKIQYTPLFEPFKIQIDGMDSITITESTLGEIVEIIDNANVKIIENRKNEIKEERQKIIDDTYEAEKQAALEKGKTYNKTKPEVDLSDLDFGNTYTYKVQIGVNNLTPKYNPEELKDYEAMFLVDAKKSNGIALYIYKYNIPYATLIFKKTKLQNTKIIQESDWVLNGVSAMNFSHLANQKDVTIPSYVDRDYYNKAAKDNIYISGDIAFGGEGFDWTSLDIFCQALKLEEKNTKKMAYQKTSDDKFTYFNIYIPINKLHATKEIETVYTPIENEFKGDLTVPVANLKATFDKSSQHCVGWSINAFESYKIPGNAHNIAESITVNVHEYMVDTTDYAELEKEINTWIDKNKVDCNIEYAMFTSDSMYYGTLTSGPKNTLIEPVIDGEVYLCVTEYVDNDGNKTGSYMKKSEYEKAVAKYTDPLELETYINDNALYLVPRCIIANHGDNKDTKVYGEVLGNGNIVSYDNFEYFFFNFEKDEDGYYKNGTVVTNECLEQLCTLYIRTYEIPEDDQDSFMNAYYNNKALGMQQWIKSNINTNNPNAQSPSTALVKTMQSNVSEATPITKFTILDSSYTLGSFSTDALKSKDYTLPRALHLEENDMYQMMLRSASKDLGNNKFVKFYYSATTSTIKALMVKSEDIGSENIEFYEGLKIGKNVSDYQSLVSTAIKCTYGDRVYYVYKNSKSALVIGTKDDVIDEISIILSTEWVYWDKQATIVEKEEIIDDGPESHIQNTTSYTAEELIQRMNSMYNSYGTLNATYAYESDMAKIIRTMDVDKLYYSLEYYTDNSETPMDSMIQLKDGDLNYLKINNTVGENILVEYKQSSTILNDDGSLSEISISTENFLIPNDMPTIESIKSIQKFNDTTILMITENCEYLVTIGDYDQVVQIQCKFVDGTVHDFILDDENTYFEIPEEYSKIKYFIDTADALEYIVSYGTKLKQFIIDGELKSSDILVEEEYIEE